jgi:hypothetical protein
MAYIPDGDTSLAMTKAASRIRSRQGSERSPVGSPSHDTLRAFAIGVPGATILGRSRADNGAGGKVPVGV